MHEKLKSGSQLPAKQPAEPTASASCSAAAAFCSFWVPRAKASALLLACKGEVPRGDLRHVSASTAGLHCTQRPRMVSRS